MLFFRTCFIYIYIASRCRCSPSKVTDTVTPPHTLCWLTDVGPIQVISESGWCAGLTATEASRKVGGKATIPTCELQKHDAARQLWSTCRAARLELRRSHMANQQISKSNYGKSKRHVGNMRQLG